MADDLYGSAMTAAEAPDAYRRRKMMQAMLEKNAMAPIQTNAAAPTSALQPLGQIANAAAAAYGPNAQAPALAPVPGDGVGPPALAGGPDQDLLKQLMAKFGMGG